MSNSEVFVSPADIAIAPIPSFTLQSGNLTTGVGFAATQAGHYCTGARIAWGGFTTSLKISLWRSSDSVRVATTTIAVSGNGLYTATFGSPFLLEAGLPYAITSWDTSGTSYCTINTGTTGTGPAGYLLPGAALGENALGGQYIVYCPYLQPSSIFGVYASGDAVPSTYYPALGFTIEPTMD
jgi:hypothetical protein